jgi:SAM-dependent methyltransferase
LVWKRLADGLAVARCEHCSLLLRLPATSRREESQYAGIDEARFRSSIGAVRTQQAIEIVRHAGNFVGRGRWLDVGAGFGWLAREARRQGFDVAGLEPDPRAAAAARTTSGSPIHEATFEHFAIPRESLDILSTLDVFEHIAPAELVPFAAKVRDVLRAGGIWLLKVPSTDGLLFQVAHRFLPLARPLLEPVVRRLWQHDEVSPHTVYFNIRSLSKFLASQGFDVVAGGYLPELTASTAADRLLAVGNEPPWRARLLAPLVGVAGLIERLRGRSDALFVIARVAS